MLDVTVDKLVDAAWVVPPNTNGTLAEVDEQSTCPSLPHSAQIDPTLAADASPWLDNYIVHSRLRSPRAFDGFHEANGLWLLSTVAAGRPVLYLSSLRLPSLYLAQVARTSVYAKSTTTRVAMDVLRASGVDCLLLPDTMTPQMFISQLIPQLPVDYDQLPAERKERLLWQACFSGQRGWFYEEFGGKLSAMMREGGTMSDFRSILRRLDDHNPTFEYATITRGRELVTQPYLSLLANLTPADLKPYARPGGALWNDGFFARFAFVVPPPTLRPSYGRFPSGRTVVPSTLSSTLSAWNARLGKPTLQVDTGDLSKGSSGGKKISVGSLPRQECVLALDVEDAFYAYHDGLLELITRSTNSDLDGNYARFAEKALRVAMLLASLENDGRIEMRHWARAQLIAERWRGGLHYMVDSLNESDPTAAEQREEKVFAALKRLNSKAGMATAREIAQGIRGMATRDVEQVLDGLVRSGEVMKELTGKTSRYWIDSVEV